jgi:nucleoside permease NupC
MNYLNSGRGITRARVTQIPVTDMVIKAIERIAEDQGFKSLKFKNQKGAIFHNADWIAGVDYDENIQQEDVMTKHTTKRTMKILMKISRMISTIKSRKMNWKT